MRKKLKQLMNREEGFTLVELLAVIVILGIIVAIAIPSIGGVINRASDNAITAENALVEDAARLYVLSEEVTFDATTGVATVSAAELRTFGYLEDRDSEETALEGTVTITEGDAATGGAATYTYAFKRD